MSDYSFSNRRLDIGNQQILFLILIFTGFVVCSQDFFGSPAFILSLCFCPICGFGSLHVTLLLGYREIENKRLAHTFVLFYALTLITAFISSYAALPLSLIPFVYYWRKP